MDIGSLFVTHAQAAKLIEPGEGSFHYPAPSTQSGAMLSITLGKQRPYVPDAQSLPD